MAALAAPLSDGIVSIAAAHGITPTTAATWYPQLARDVRVLVPMELDVLMVRDATLSWANCGMTPPLAPPVRALLLRRSLPVGRRSRQHLQERVVQPVLTML